MTKTAKPPIAVIGMAANFPGGAENDGFWRSIVAGRDCLSDVPPTHWLIGDYYDADPKRPGKTYAKRGGFLDPVAFDPLENGMPPAALPATDTVQLLALAVGRRVLKDACDLKFDHIDRSRTSVILGVASATELVNTMSGSLQQPIWARAMREEGLPEDEITALCDRMASYYVDWTENTFPGLLGNVAAGRVANRFDLGGTNCVVDAACAGSLAALQMAVQELWNGDADMAITGGVDALNDIFMFMCFSKTPAMSPTGDCRPFAADADGTMLGEGVGMFALRRLADAERDGDRIYAVIEGIGSSSDGRAKSIYAPRAEGQELALTRAYDAAGYGPDTVELLEAHGTGTNAGDAAEVKALKAVFAASGRTDTGWCALGSVKSQIGHTKAAAGAASLYKTVMALHHKVLPPTIKVGTVNPALGIADSAFRVNTGLRPWVGHGRHPRRASVSSFGFGGSNFHLTLEEYRGPAPRPPRVRTLAAELFLFSAATPEALLASADAVAGKAKAAFARAARDSQVAFDAGAGHRLAIVAADADGLAARIATARGKLAAPVAAWHASGVAYGSGPRATGKLAFLFPGQGSQYLDMGSDIVMAFPRAAAVWDQANTAHVAAGYPALATDVFPAAPMSSDEAVAQKARLTATDRAQPAIGVTSLMLLDLLRAAGVEPDLVAGHSFGELTALHAAGVFDVDGFLAVARDRGELMAAAARATAGAMLAVSASVEEVGALLAELAPKLVVANINAPRQVVVAGATEAVAEFEARLGERKVSAKRLPVATAFHSPIVAGAVPAFAERLAPRVVAAPAIPVIAGSTAAPYPDDPASIRALLAGQLAEPVRFVELVSALYDRGARTFVEIGPRGVLTDLVGRCLASREHAAFASNSGAANGVADVWSAFARLAAAGVPLDLGFAWEGYCVDEAPVAAQSPATVMITGANYGKRYPVQDGAAPPRPATLRPRPAPQVPPAAAGASRLPIDPPLPVPTQPEVQVAAALPVAADTGWLAALQQIQTQTAETHAVAQRAMADAHIAYLKATEVSFVQLRELAMGGAAGGAASMSAPALLPPAPIAAPSSTGAAAAVVAVPSVQPLSSEPSPVRPVAAMPDLTELVLDIVAEKTGYPRDILGLDMDLEADLGIDSIKRVEILASVAERRPDLPQIDTQTLGTLRTLGAILSHFGASMPATAAVPVRGAVATMPDLTELVLGTLAEKTGYPRDILGLDMDLEADLGIDSIKRVEILASVAEHRPDLPEIDTQTLGTLRTLGAILSHLGASATAPAAIALAATTMPDLTELVLDTVAEKTGYPRDILGLEMDLEADLGIDSIKRVEILATVAEHRPDLPEIDTQTLGTLRTLGAILDYLGGAPAGLAAAPEPLPRRGIGEVPADMTGRPAVAGIASARSVAIVGDGGGLAVALEKRLRTHGVAAAVAATVPQEADAVVAIGDAGGHAGALATARQLFAAAKGFAPHATTSGGAFVTVQDSGGDFGCSASHGEAAWTAGAPGFVRTLAQEWPLAAVRAIDLERGGQDIAACADRLANELLAGGAPEIGLHADGRRTTLAEIDLPLVGPNGFGHLGDDCTLVVSGGARGVTAACLLALARTTTLRLLLLGRTPIREGAPELAEHGDEVALKAALLAQARARGEKVAPNVLARRAAAILADREVRDTLAAFAALGCEALYRDVDVTDGAAVAVAVGEARARWGRIDGIVHGAGTLADKRVADKTPEQFDRVVATKLHGLQALLAATRDDALRLICLFSSVAARYGNPGQADYALANDVLNQVARAEAVRRGPNCLVRSIGWGPWDGGMVTPALAREFERRGVPIIGLTQGTAAFVAEIGHPATGAAAGAAGADIVLGAALSG